MRLMPSGSTPRRFALLALLPFTAPAAEFGSLKVTQLANTNQNLASATPGLSISHGLGGSNGASIKETANRGDYELSFGNIHDVSGGVLISSIAQLSRDDSGAGGPAPGEFFATSSLGINSTMNNFWIAIHWAEVGNNLEANYDVSYVYLPYDEFPGGVASNESNNSALNLFTGTPGLGNHFTDPAETSGEYSLDLSSVDPAASQNGILLVTGGKNEDNYALSQANSDGTFTLYCHDNGSNGRSYENDGVGFSYLATSAIGTHGLVALGRINGDASTDVSAGSFTVTKGPKGQWFLSIPDHSDQTGTLVVSPEGGDTNNIDNILATAWDADESRWVIESRDLNGIPPQIPALQDMSRNAEDVFSFAFFSAGVEAPEITANSPVDGEIKVSVDAPLSVTVDDDANEELEVVFYGRRVAAADPVGEFSVIALPDTQFYSENKGGSLAAIFSAQTDWIVAERDARHIGFVMHLGDLTQHGDNPSTAAEEWANASDAMYRLEDPLTTLSAEGIPYIVAVGNHDQTPIGNADGTTTNFNTFFGVHPQTGVNHFADKSYYGDTSEPGSADNHYTLFTAGGIDFIVISLEYDTTADAEDLAWADALLKAHPTRRGIIITHYLVRSGFPAPFGPQGAAIYEELKDNKNLIFMHGGHIHGEGLRSDTYDDHTIHSMLADYQGRSNGGDGWLRILRFRPTLNRVEMQTYSPVLDQYETDSDSQFSIDVDLSSGMGPFTEISRTTVAPGNAIATWSGLESGTRYEWYATVGNGSRESRTETRSFITDGVLFAPNVELSSPANGATQAAPANFQIEANANDLDGSVSRVDFFSGTQLLGSDTTEPYTFTWTGVETGSYTVIAKAIDNDGEISSSTPIFVQVVTEPSPPDVSTTSSALINPNWVVYQTSPVPRGFDNPGTNLGDIALKINGTSVAFHTGIIAATNWENPGNIDVDSIDNLCLPYSSESGTAYVNVRDNTNPNASDANPTSSEESAGTAVAYFPYPAGWIGASVSGDAEINSGNLPTGVGIRRIGDGLYSISGLALTGNLLAFPNGNSGNDGDNTLSVRTGNGHWMIETRDNSSSPQNGSFSFVYVPASTPSIASGLIESTGNVIPLNTATEALGVSVTKSSDYFELTIGNGAQMNPTTCALFLVGDSSDSLAAADNVISYSSSGNSFRIFSQDLPNLTGNFQAIDLRFLAIPFDISIASDPELTLISGDPSSCEYGENTTLGFTVTRSGATSSPLTVFYTVSGTATQGADFTTLSGSLEIPAGQESAMITVTALADQLTEGTESVTLSLFPGTSYHLGTPNSATGMIDDRPYQEFLYAEGLASPEADDDSDGLANILEYYMGSAAGDATEKAVVRAIQNSDGTFHATFPHSKSATDLDAHVEWSLNLEQWHRSGQSDGHHTGEIQYSVTSAANEDPETIKAVLTLSGAPPTPSVFLRLFVEP